MNGKVVADALRQEFSRTAINAGFDRETIQAFRHAIIQEDHKYACFHFFAKDSLFLNKLERLAIDYKMNAMPERMRGMELR